MKKIILLLIGIMFVTGCRVSNTVTINRDLSVKEELNMTGTTSFFNNYYKDRPISVVNMMLDTSYRKETLINNGYTYVINKDNFYPAVVTSKKYNSISSYVNDTIFKEQYFNSFKTETKDNLVTIKASDFIPYNPDNPNLYAISDFSYHVKLPYVVVNHNADSYDPKTNTYTWKIDIETKEKEIEITFDKSKIYVYNLVMYISIFILILLALMALIIILKMVKKNKKNNRIID